MRCVILLASVLFLLKYVHSAKILGVFPMDWGSHYILGSKLMKGLAEAGHDVTMINPRKLKDLPKNGNWTDVLIDEDRNEYHSLLNEANLFDESNKNIMEKLKDFTRVLMYVSNQTLRDTQVQKLMNSNATFDAVIIEQLMNDCHHVFASHFNCPLIILSSIGPNVMLNTKVGNPSPVSTVRHFYLQNNGSGEMTLFERLQNLFYNVFSYLFIYVYVLPQHNAILHEVFPNAPDINDLYYNASLVLLNSHTSMVEAVPVVPNMVEIGGYHIDPPQKLPKDLQYFLDNAKDGAIYFSMGSNLKSKDMPDDKKRTLLRVFKKLKQKVLWKFEEDLPGKPDNVLIKNWMPQQDILAHPNIKLFITHGGLLSTTETIYHGVPVLAIPVFGDQEMNANKAVYSGFGLKISYNDNNFNEETLTNLIEELLNNPKYKENALYRSKIYHDRPLSPMQSAVYWVEYVIRHKGAPHLRVKGVEMSWYKYFMLDVLALVIGSIVIIVFSLTWIWKKIVQACQSKITKSVKKKTK